MYITTRFSNAADNKAQVDELCAAVVAAGFEDFHFIRDVEHYQKNVFPSQKALWAKAKECIEACDALLIDVSDSPSGGRVVEAGIAYALGKPVYVIVRKGVAYKDFYDGIAAVVIEYESRGDVVAALRPYATQLQRLL